MAKKGKKKATKKSAKRMLKSKPAKPAGKGAWMVEVKTGKGASPAEIGGQLVAMFNQGKFKEIEDKFWSPAIVSCEGVGVNMEWRGRRAVEEKNTQWLAQNEILGARATGPFVGSTGFAVQFDMDVRENASGNVKSMREVGVYTVRDGKIIREEFMYAG